MLTCFPPSFFPRRSLCILTIALALTFGSIATLRAEQATVDNLLQHFDSVVFGSEYAEVKSAERIQKWMSPIRVSISAMQGNMINKPGGGRELKLKHARPSPKQVAMIRKHLTTLVKITGVSSEKSDKKNGKPANFVIKFVPRIVMGQGFLAKDVDPKIIKRLGNAGVCVCVYVCMCVCVCVLLFDTFYYYWGYVSQLDSRE